MKSIYLLLVLVSSQLWSQDSQFRGVVKDAETLQPIPYVNIYSERESSNNLVGSISNENGEFTIAGVKAKIVFSHINYEPLTIEFDGSLKEILLKPKIYVLDEVIISNEATDKYLRRMIDLSKNRLDKNSLLKSYCREIVKVNNEYTKFADALVNYYVKKGNGKSTIVLLQHRALQSDKLDADAERSVEGINSVFNVNDYVRHAYDFEIVENLLKSNDGEYEFVRRIKREANGVEYERIDIVPNETSTKMLNSGYVIIDPKAKIILEFKVFTSEKHLQFAEMRNILIAKARLNKRLFWSKFRLMNNQYILTYNRKYADIYIKMGKKVNHTFEFNSDVFVYEFLSNVEIPKNGYGKKTIFQAGTNFTEKYWAKYNAFPLSEQEQKFIESVQPQ